MTERETNIRKERQICRTTKCKNEKRHKKAKMQKTKKKQVEDRKRQDSLNRTNKK